MKPALFAFFLPAVSLYAQTSGALSGAVSDPSNLGISGASVRVVSLATAEERRLLTGPDGSFLVPALFPGDYRIEVAHPGFRTQIRDGVDLTVGRTLHIDFRLSLGETAETVNVTAEPPLVSSRAADWGGSLAQQKLAALPLRERDMFDLAAQQPGVTRPTNTTASMFTGFGVRLSVNGSRPWQNTFRLDGIYINDSSGAAPASASGRLLGLETIAEVHLITSPFSAEYGRAAGAVFTAVSKSGSNDLHGSAYEYFRHNRLDARNFFDAPSEPMPPLRKNQFGGLLSGPLKRNRLFLLGNFEGVREAFSRTAIPVTLSDDARRGILSPGAAPVAISPAVRPYLDLYPRANGRVFTNGTAEYVTTLPVSVLENYAATRADAVFTDRLRSSARYTFDAGQTATPDPFHIWDFQSQSRYHLIHTDTQYLHSPRTIYQLRAGFSRIWNSEISVVDPEIPSSLSFVPGQPLGTIRVTGLNDLGGGRNGNVMSRPRRYVLNDYQTNLDATFLRGAHSFRWGAGYSRMQHNQLADVSAAGLYRFDSIADFFAARPRAGDMMAPGSNSIRGFRQHHFFGYLQDDWRWSTRLNVSLGVRYEGYSVPTEVNGKIAVLKDVVDDSQTTVGIPLFRNPSRKNFAPRAALAWDLSGRSTTVLRFGGGIFFDLIGSRELLAAGNRMPPFFIRAAPLRPNFPNLLSSVIGSASAISIDTLDYNVQQPYSAQFQFRLEHQFGPDTIVQAGYSGARGIRLIGQISNVNTTRPDILPDGRLFFSATSPRMNPAFEQIGMRRSHFDSNYHSLQLFLQRRWRQGLQFQVKYGWGKSLDTHSTMVQNDYLSSDGIPSVFNYRQNYGPSDYDLRHDFAANFSYRLPGGWELQGLLSLRSGQPFSPQVGFDRARLRPSSNDQGQRPDATGMPTEQIIQGGVQQYFNPLAFTLPAAGFLGNTGRNTLPGPGQAVLDAAVHKALWRTDRQAVTLRIEAFNVTNRPNFATPANLDLFDSQLRRIDSAGRITSTSTPSRQMQIAVRWTF